MSRLLGALVLDRYAAVLLVKLERSVVADFARLRVVSSNVEQIMIRVAIVAAFRHGLWPTN